MIWDGCTGIQTSAPWPRLFLICFNWCLWPPFLNSSAIIGTLEPPLVLPSVWIGAPVSHSMFSTPFLELHRQYGYSSGGIDPVQSPLGLLSLYRHYCISFSTAQSTSVYSSFPHIHCSSWGLLISSDSCSPFSLHLVIILFFKPHFDLQLAKISSHLCTISQIKPKSLPFSFTHQPGTDYQ